MHFRQFVIGVVLLIALGSAGCARPVSKATQGGLAGAALGAGTGAIIGSATGKAGAGTAIGAGLGALGGALLGNALDQQDAEREALEEQVARNNAVLEENRKIIEELKKRGADVRSSDRGVVINLPDILFKFDRYELTPEARVTIGEISEVLRSVSNRTISVEGHTDSVGTMDYNKRLSINRATSVRDELADNGIPRDQMSVQGFGEGSPIATNNTDAGRQRNRRVEVIVEN